MDTQARDTGTPLAGVQATQRPDPLFRVAARLLYRLPEIGGLVAVGTGFAYVVGWIQANAYFGKIGASWLVQELGPIALFSWSAWPLLGFLFIFYLLAITVAKGEEEDHVNPERLINGIVRYGISAIVFMLVAAAIVPHVNILRGTAVQYVLITISSLTYLAISAAAMLKILILARAGVFVGDNRDIGLVYVAVVFGAYLVPSSLGGVQAQRDLDLTYSQLPVVVTTDSRNLRLVVKVEETYYTIDPADTMRPPGIVPIPQAVVVSVRGKGK